MIDDDRCVIILECSAVINRFGFNSKGVDHVAANLRAYRGR